MLHFQEIYTRLIKGPKGWLEKTDVTKSLMMRRRTDNQKTQWRWIKNQIWEVEGKRGQRSRRRRRMWPNPAWQICFREQRARKFGLNGSATAPTSGCLRTSRLRIKECHFHFSPWSLCLPRQGGRQMCCCHFQRIPVQQMNRLKNLISFNKQM